MISILSFFIFEYSINLVIGNNNDPNMLGKPKPPHLPFDIITTIAQISIPIYRVLLALPRFGRASLTYKHQLLHQSHFTHHEVDNDGTHHWYLIHSRPLARRSILHRLDGPAIVESNGTQVWFYNGRYHRVDNPAIIRANGDQSWFYNGQYHRVDGPAVSGRGFSAYYQNGKPHRLNGPAVIYPDGKEQYWLNGKRSTKEQVMGI